MILIKISYPPYHYGRVIANFVLESKVIGVLLNQVLEPPIQVIKQNPIQKKIDPEE